MAGVDDQPVVRHREAIIDLLKSHQVVIVSGETGSGKSTQLPKFLREAGVVHGTQHKLLVTQPRRLAAVSLATRVSEELNVKLGEEVGYNVRFDTRVSASKTEIKFATEGMMLRELLANPTLEGYTAVLLDEVHERTLDADVILCLLRELLHERSDFKLVISSATLESEKLLDYFGRDRSASYTVRGRTFPVEKLYLPHSEPGDYIPTVVHTVVQIHETEKDMGAILVFLPGQAEIEQTKRLLEAEQEQAGLEMAEMLTLPVHSTMNIATQQLIFQTPQRGQRKIVLATNIAETSLTIPDVRFVVDTGLVKTKQYDFEAGMDTLTVGKCSAASAEQRAGRAGRTGPGKCYRLYTKKVFEGLPKQTPPEILRANLSQVCLLLLSLGVADPLKFPWIDQPPLSSVIQAMRLLYILGAVNSDGKLTKLGRVISEFPTDPRWARTLLSFDPQGASNLAVIAAAMVGESAKVYENTKNPDAAAAHKMLVDARGDIHTLVNVYRQWESSGYATQWCRANFVDARSLRRAKNVVRQLGPLTSKMRGLLSTSMRAASTPDLTQAICTGFFMNAAMLSLDKQNYVPLDGSQTLYIHPSSVLRLIEEKPPLIIYHELILTAKEYIRGCMVIHGANLDHLAPKPLDFSKILRYL